MIDRVLPAVRRWREDHPAPLLVVSIAGAQGSGKSTLARGLAEALEAEGIATGILSLDDLYLTRGERQRLARDVHRLLVTRGVPGTHDVALGLATIGALARGEPALLPRFDKGRDDRLPLAEWPQAAPQTRVLLFEGWCVGARPQPPALLAAPVNALERDEDGDGRWRAFANAALGDAYATLWAALDRQVFLAAPDWPTVARWREQQEAELRRTATGAMTVVEVARFVLHYERLTRWMLTDQPHRADLTVKLDPDRHAA